MTLPTLKSKSIEYWKHWYCLINFCQEEALFRLLYFLDVIPEEPYSFLTEFREVEQWLDANKVDTERLLNEYEKGAIEYKPSDFNNY